MTDTFAITKNKGDSAMKFLTFTNNDNTHKLGLLHGNDEVIDLSILDPVNPMFQNMINFIQGGDEAVFALEKSLNSPLKKEATLKLEEVTVLAPIPRPIKNIYCVGLNYVEHNNEFAGEDSNLPEHPIIFSKAPSTVIGPDAEILSHPEVTSEIDYEAELGVVIGCGGRNISKEEAYDHIFGYTIINDITARDLQRKHQQWLLGKSLDTFCPMGPYIVKSDAIENINEVNISSRVNGEIRQSSNTKHMIFDIATIISTISKGHTLEAGDIIATGTPAGVGMGFDPPKYLNSGDVVEVEIEGIGILKNTIS